MAEHRSTFTHSSNSQPTCSPIFTDKSAKKRLDFLQDEKIVKQQKHLFKSNQTEMDGLNGNKDGMASEAVIYEKHAALLYSLDNKRELEKGTLFVSRAAS